MVGDNKGAWSPLYTATFEYVVPAIVTDISNTEADSTSQNVYDLQGRRVNTVRQGLYIINGRVVAK